MRKRLNNAKLVASTNVKTKEVINQINGRKTKPEALITVGERTGINRRAVLECKKSTTFNTMINTGKFDCITNKTRVEEKLITKMIKHVSN